MKHRFIHTCLSLFLASTALSVNAYEKIEKAQAEKLGAELTPLGADPKANADGSIPAWKGDTLGVPKGLQYAGSGSAYPDPYADEKPLFSITKDNLEQHKNKLSPGMVALFEKYPESYRMDIYPSHRDFRYTDKFERRTRWNVGNAELVNGIDGLQKMTGGVPFAIPQNGAEAIWNARSSQPIPVADSLFDEIAVYANGSSERYRNKLIIESPYAYAEHPVGKVVEEIGVNSALVFYEVLEPSKKKGEMVIVHEPLDQVKNDRKAWVYIPGTQRVRRAPNAGFDTPVGPGGLMTADDSMGFNGAMLRYDWTLIGKQEMYVPYHSYSFDKPDISYDDLIPPRHVNPDHMRYELQRVWVVEANLKKGQRHSYGKRRFYIAEDNWLIAASEAYDGRGDLWRVGLQNTVYDYHLKGYIARAQFLFDLQASAYVVGRLTNQTRPSNYAMEVKGEDFYSPSNLRKMGR